MPTIAQTLKFEDRKNFVGERIQTCGYRFYKILQTRRKQIPRLKQSSGNPQIQNQIRDKVINTVDDYVHCLRAQHRGGEIPEYLSDSVNQFKQQTYTHLAPQFILEDLRLVIANKIFDQNYTA